MLPLSLGTNAAEYTVGDPVLSLRKAVQTFPNCIPASHISIDFVLRRVSSIRSGAQDLNQHHTF